MRTKIQLNWNIEIDIENNKDMGESNVLDLSLKSSNLMNCLGDTLRNMEFHKLLNSKINKDFKVISISPKCATKKLIIEC